MQMLGLHVWELFTSTRGALALTLCSRAFLKKSRQRSFRFLFVSEKQNRFERRKKARELGRFIVDQVDMVA